jgi:ABC-type transport system substrate-binding protein
MALYPFVNGDDPDTTDQFACANVPPHGYNKSRICEPRIDALLNAGRTTFDVAKRKAIYARLEEELISQLPIALLYQRRELDAFSTRIHNQTTSLSTAFWNVGAWSLEK